ncbi:MAG: hypothetical protein JXB49_23950 [Bacteroidales bacterium]|nr:hypothetical protein [Bacteroidales bacterium]
MSEFDLRTNPFHSPGYPIKIDYSLVQLDLYRLLCCFGASSIIERISRKYSNTLINSFLRIEYEKSEISRIIINLAIIARNELDNGNGLRTNNPNFGQDKVGILYKAGKTRKLDLSFREACNKIIHCEYINWDMKKPVSIAEYDGLNPIIYLYGSLNEARWKAVLKIYDFVNVYIGLIQL